MDMNMDYVCTLCVRLETKKDSKERDDAEKRNLCGSLANTGFFSFSRRQNLIHERPVVPARSDGDWAEIVVGHTRERAKLRYESEHMLTSISREN